MKRSLRTISLGCLLVFLLSACLRDFEKIEIDGIQPTWALPIINSKLGVQKLLARQDSTDLIQAGENGELALVYRTSFSGPDNSIFSFPDVLFQEGFSFTHPGNNVTLDTTLSFSESIEQKFNIVSPKIVEAQILSGSFRVSVSTSFKDARLNIEFPGIIGPDQVRVSMDLNLPPGESSFPVDLTNAIIDFAPNPGDFNTLFGDIAITVDYNETYSNPTNEYLDVIFDFSDLEYQSLKGNFGGLNLFELQDSILIKVFKSSVAGVVQLVDPKIKISSTSNIGAPMALQFNELSTTDLETAERNEIVFSENDGLFILDFPKAMGNVVEDEKIINDENSNLRDLLTPKNQNFYVDFAMGIDSNSSSFDNFLTRGAQMDMNVDMELPLAGFAHSWEMVDTLDFSFSFEQELVEDIDFKIIMDNGFPVGADLQIYFLNDAKQVVDSLITEAAQFMVPAKTNAEGRVIQKSKTVNVITIPHERAQNIFASSFIVLDAEIQTFNGPQEQIIRFYDDYFIDIKVGFLGKFKVEI